MTKSFLAFPTGLSGAALLLLRLSAGLALLDMLAHGAHLPLILDLSLGVLMLALVLGIFTRASAGIVAVLAALVGFHLGGPLGALCALYGLDALALSMLGAGGYSVDARLFGRRVITLES